MGGADANAGADADCFVDEDGAMHGPGTEEEWRTDDGLDIGEAPLTFMDELTQQARAQKKRGQSIRTKAFTIKEDELICSAWRDDGQDHKTGAEQKGSVFWRRIYAYFHERKMYPPFEMECIRMEESIKKRWSLIQLECNKFCATVETISNRPVSGLGVGDMV